MINIIGRLLLSFNILMICNSIAICDEMPKDWVPTWEYHVSKDKMGRGEIKTATIYSNNEIEFKHPYDGKQRAGLCIRNHPRFEKEVLIRIDKGQFICGIYNCPILIRFDDGRALKFIATPPADYSSNLLFLKNSRKFLSYLRKAKKIYIETQVYQEGARIFEFEVENLNWKWLKED